MLFGNNFIKARFMGLLTILFLLNCAKIKQSVIPVAPPEAEKIPKTLTAHGHIRTDNYFWMNERENPKVIAYLEAENAYRQAVMKPTLKLEKKLYGEIIGRIKQDDASAPYPDNGYTYFWRYEKGQEYPVHLRRKNENNAPEEILLNVPKMAEGHSYYHAAGLTVSPNNRFLAFGVDTVSRRKYIIHFKDLASGKLLADKLYNSTGRAVWANDNKTIFYCTKDSTLRVCKIWKHVLGQDPSEDIKIYEETDNTYSLSAYKSKTGKYIIFGSYQTLATEMRLIDADAPDKPPVIFQKREKNHEYHISHHLNKFYIRTNWKAKNFRLMVTDENKPGKRHWKEVLPNREDVLLEDVDEFMDFLVLSERKAGILHLQVRDLMARTEHDILFNEEAYVAYPKDNRVFDSHILRLYYTSMTTPGSDYDYDLKSKKMKLLKQAEVGGKFNKNDYQSERLWAVARDGAQIPVSLVYKKGLIKDGNAPLLLYGYGSYGYSMEPYFSAQRLSLLNRGFVFAIAHIRGGSEMGRQWYEDGKLLKKKNTFTDFIDCAQFLIAENYTSPDKLFAEGGSAGGLLVGAVANMRPDLFKGVIAQVPWVDVVTTMLDESIPLTTGEFDEWGNPKDKKYYDYMLSYSPYDNVEAKAYPAMYVSTGLHDSQVQYFEPTKWVAKLRELKTDNNLILLDVDMGAGHGGASGRFKRYEVTAREYTFMLNELGIDK